ncbi:MAG TPA: S9 family peptidase [Vicinamibacteria bacterium]|nr:S9 family peptidase [Vicinamibacteria bacterium]
MSPRFPVSLAVVAVVLAPAFASGRAASPVFNATEMMKLRRLSDPQVAPDGSQVAYALTEIDLTAGKRNTDLWLAPVSGGEPRRLTSNPASDSRPRFRPDGRRIAFLSTRDGSSQVWVLDLAGGEPVKATSLATDVEAFDWIDGDRLLVVSAVFPDCGADPTCNSKRLGEAGKPSSARVYDDLLVRHWDVWSDGRRRHLLLVPTDGGTAVDLTPGGDDVPPFSLGGEDWAVAPDGGEVCFSRKDAKDEAWSTNAEVFVVPTAGGPARRVSDAAGYDGGCRYSPDGSLLAWRSQVRAGYEADRWRLVVMDRKTGARRTLTEVFDRPVDSFAFSPDGKTVYFTAEEAGRSPVFSVPAAGGTVRTVLAGGTFGDLSVSPDGRVLVATEVALTHPAEIVRFGTDGSGLTRVTQVNDALLAGFALRPGESVNYAGAAGKSVQAWVVKPPDFDPAKKYPLLVLVHGGPQGAWADGWTYRWNAQVFASAGYVVFMPNPRGSVGWGQAFTDDVNRDWGGKAYEDVMKGTDFAESLPYVEKGRTSAAGASYGGYMINWIAGQTGRFKALVSHDGVFDLVSMYGSTEELWFPEWEFGGPYWANPTAYTRHNPRDFVRNFKTPTLVVHGEKDYRVPLEQGLAMFTALRRQGVPARLLVFPDENHWVLKPANSVRWYDEVIGWLDRWTKR